MLQRRFQTVFEVRGVNLLTGEPEVRNVSILTDDRLTVGRAKQQIRDLLAVTEGPSGITRPDEIVLIEGFSSAQTPFIEEG